MTTDSRAQLARQVRNDIQKMQSEFEAALPPQIPADRFVRTAITAVQMNPDLLATERKSLLGACMKAAQDGLMIDGREAALVIFKNKAQYMPMVAGLLKKARQSGQVSSISAHVVYERDQFDYELGDNERILHKPLITGERGKPIAVYAIGRMNDGGVYREVMSVAQVEKVRSVSRTKNSGPWETWWDEMARKTVIRRLAKYMPSSTDLDQVLSRDDEQGGQVIDATVMVDQPGPVDVITELNQQIAAAAPEPEPEPATEPEAAVEAEVVAVDDPFQ